MLDVINEIIDLWTKINPVTGYTSGYLKELNNLFFQNSEHVSEVLENIYEIEKRLDEITDEDIQYTAKALLLSFKTQLKMSRPSGAGPSGTGMSGIWMAADGIFYIVLKGDYNKPFVSDYLDKVLEMVEYETSRWFGQTFSIEVRKECLDTSKYISGTLQSLKEKSPSLQSKIDKISEALNSYIDLFYFEGLDSDDFKDYWPLLAKWDNESGAERVNGYPECLTNYYQLTEKEEEIEKLATGWLKLDLPVLIDISHQIAQELQINAPYTLESIWNKISEKYKVNFDTNMIKKVCDVCSSFGKQYIINYNKDDLIEFDSTPSYLVDLVTGGEDFAVNYLVPKEAYSQLYLTESKNTSILTMINILVHEASHGYNFVLSAKSAAPILNLNTSLEVPMTEGQAFYREYQYWSAAQNLLNKEQLSKVEQDYLNLYGNTRKEQELGVLCAQFETYIWRVIRYIRALCDVKVNGGYMTYTDFIKWAAKVTSLSEKSLHEECFTFLASPGYAPCYAIGCADYAFYQKNKLLDGITEIEFNTNASKLGFYAWPINKKLMESMR